MISQKNIHIITLSELGGAQKFVLAQALKDKKDNIETIIASEDKTDWLYQQAKLQQIKYIAIKQLKRSINPFKDLLTLLELIALIKAEKPTHIYLNSSKIGFLGSLAGKICGTPNIYYIVHGWVFNEPLSFCKKNFYRLIEKISATWKTKIFFINNFDLEIAKKLKIGNVTQYELIKLNIEPINFLEKNDAKEKLFNTSDYNNKNIVGSIANAYPTKNLTALVSIADQLKDYKDLLFVIIGDGPQTPELKKLISDSKLNNILLLGKIENASRYLKAFDLFVLTSVKEGTPYVLLEAQQAGIPILSTPVGGVPEILPVDQLCQIINMPKRIVGILELE